MLVPFIFLNIGVIPSYDLNLPLVFWTTDHCGGVVGSSRDIGRGWEGGQLLDCQNIFLCKTQILKILDRKACFLLLVIVEGTTEKVLQLVMRPQHSEYQHLT